MRGDPGPALRRPHLQQPCAKTAWIGSMRPHPPRARRFFCRAASAPEGSAKIRATRRARDWRSPLTVKRTRAGAPPTPQRAIAALAQPPARHAHGAAPRKVAHPLALGVTGASAWAPASVAPAPPRPAAPPALRMLMGCRKILFYFMMSRFPPFTYFRMAPRQRVSRCRRPCHRGARTSIT